MQVSKVEGGEQELTDEDEISFKDDAQLVDFVTRMEGCRRLLADLERHYGFLGVELNSYVQKKYPMILWAEWMYDQYTFKFIRRKDVGIKKEASKS